MREEQYEDLLCVSTGYFSSLAIKRLGLTSKMRRHYQLNRFYICMSMGNYWKEKRFPCKPTKKQIRKAINGFKKECAQLNAEYDAYCESE